MRNRGPTLTMMAALTLAACTGKPPAPDQDDAANGQSRSAAGKPEDRAGQRPRWTLRSGRDGMALIFASAGHHAILRLSCPAGQKQLVVNVPAFRPIGSEERLSFGGGTDPLVLAADTRGDRDRGGVTGTGDVPANLAALIGDRIAASYGAQTTGPYPAPAGTIARDFVAACESEPRASGTGAARDTGPGACMVQDGEELGVRPVRAIGTEPFWGVRIEGRCVTYSDPTDQDGVRIWTRYTADSGGRWSGALGGRLFEVRLSDAPGCSDGMSDKSYPLAVALIVNGERRQGCAERSR